MSINILIISISFLLSFFIVITILIVRRKKNKSYSETLYYINCTLLGLLPPLFLIRLVSAAMIVKGADVPNMLRYAELAISPFYGMMLILHITFNRQYFLMPAVLFKKKIMTVVSGLLHTELKQAKLIDDTTKS